MKAPRIARRARAIIATPTPMPALAPVERPDEEDLLEADALLGVVVPLPDELVAVAVEEAIAEV